MAPKASEHSDAALLLILNSGFTMDAAAACRQVVNQSMMTQAAWDAFTRSVRKRAKTLRDKSGVAKSPMFANSSPLLATSVGQKRLSPKTPAQPTQKRKKNRPADGLRDAEKLIKRPHAECFPGQSPSSRRRTPKIKQQDYAEAKQDAQDYSIAFKAATAMYFKEKQKPHALSDNRLSAQEVSRVVSKEMEEKTGRAVIVPEYLIRRHGNADTAGKSPPKRGPKPVIPEPLCNALGTWAQIKQLQGNEVGVPRLVQEANKALSMATNEQLEDAFLGNKDGNPDERNLANRILRASADRLIVSVAARTPKFTSS